ncbi:LOW QUALITY PROTEIN: uncharacterized protein LOC114642072 [Erpetoichthys calabaricus]|uniref:Glycosyltransferase family 92 protein n=1 Tax=Erpetoichthys calabaricus TaxID=27687 RepID=A0A8C4T3V3_ERPCA|nr:LOW QUALITY PROTEIN: uncharacterized protein LOC114642072 [Erpetoichthys calabaricus]
MMSCVTMSRKNLQQTFWIFLFLVLLVVLWVFNDLQGGPEFLYLGPNLSLLFLNETISPIKGTRHLQVSAYLDERKGKGTVRIITMFYRPGPHDLQCIFNCNNGVLFTSPAQVEQHSDNFGFPFVTADVFCETSYRCKATHVGLQTQGSVQNNDSLMPIQNLQQRNNGFERDLTVCISNLFGDYNNVLQFIQTMEVYKILGIGRVVIYNTSSSHMLEKVLHYYVNEDMLEVIPWPISNFLNPSRGWRFEEHGGDIHYFGQLTTLNDCIYRNMYKSRFLLLNDIDEIIAPYQHTNLNLMMDELEKKQPDTGVFLVENHIYPFNVFDDSGRFNLSLWRQVPGINIMEHIHREPDRKHIVNPTKIIVNPRKVEQTSVHSVLKRFGNEYRVPFDVCRIVHVRVPLQGHLSKEELIVDTKLWEYHKELVPRVNKVIGESGILR